MRLAMDAGIDVLLGGVSRDVLWLEECVLLSRASQSPSETPHCQQGQLGGC